MTDTFHDALTTPGTPGLPLRFFDRFLFNLHPKATAPSVIVGLGVYPAADVIDGFAIAVTETEQRNLRFSTELSATNGTGAGPLSWRVKEPLRTTFRPAPSRCQPAAARRTSSRRTPRRAAAASWPAAGTTGGTAVRPAAITSSTTPTRSTARCRRARSAPR
ncbi:MAG TPA: hypothetical protein VHZ03_38455 [Trebonia sp.]|jgi:hypothetical protein|nr:hypothetical protein [Trebonia sp.]